MPTERVLHPDPDSTATADGARADAAKPGLTYAQAGVSIDEGDAFVSDITRTVASTYSARVLSGIGGFAGLFRLDYNQRLFKKNYKNPVLVACTDGVGTKIKIARALGKHDTIGIDLVAMCVNDAICCGAEPLFFLDYLVTSRLDRAVGNAVIQGIVEGCRQAECALLGGETAEHPGDMPDGDYDLAGFCVGVVEKKRILDGSTVKVGDLLIGIPSSGVHSNGFTLARRAVEVGGLKLTDHIAELGRPLGEALLTPTTIYVRALMAVIHAYRRRRIPGAIIHITGGGLEGNVPRCLPPHTRARIDTTTWEVPPIFDVIARAGTVDRAEMFRVFNMGIGMVLAIPEFYADSTIRRLAREGATGARVIGRIVASHEAEPSAVLV